MIFLWILDMSPLMDLCAVIFVVFGCRQWLIHFLIGIFWWAGIFILIKSIWSIFSFIVLWPPGHKVHIFFQKFYGWGFMLRWITDHLWSISVVLGFTSLVWSFTFRYMIYLKLIFMFKMRFISAWISSFSSICFKRFYFTH